MDIKFRGRRPNGEWVYGAYIPPEYTQLGYASILTKNQRFEVDPETVSAVQGGNGDYGEREKGGEKRHEDHICSAPVPGQ